MLVEWNNEFWFDELGNQGGEGNGQDGRKDISLSVSFSASSIKSLQIDKPWKNCAIFKANPKQHATLEGMKNFKICCCLNNLSKIIQ